MCNDKVMQWVVKQPLKLFHNLFTGGSIFLALVSIIWFALGIVLIAKYNFVKFSFWSSMYTAVPVILIVLGLYTFAVAFFGIVNRKTENPSRIIILAVLLCLSSLVHVAMDIVAMQLDSVVHGNSGSITKLNAFNVDPNVTIKLDAQMFLDVKGVTEVNEQMAKYSTGANVEWDAIQQTMHCCGGYDLPDGYHGYLNYKGFSIGQDNSSVPDSCCKAHSEGCGKNIFARNSNETLDLIYQKGCLTVFKESLNSGARVIVSIIPILGWIVWVVEIILISFCRYYQINLAHRLTNI